MLPKNAGKRVGIQLREQFDGDTEAAKEAIEQLSGEPKVLEAWATRMLRSEPYGANGRPEGTGPDCKAFSWDEVPPAMREAAIRGMAMAYLVETSERKRGVA